jgi:hypothetical protein
MMTCQTFPDGENRIIGFKIFHFNYLKIKLNLFNYFLIKQHSHPLVFFISQMKREK